MSHALLAACGISVDIGGRCVTRALDLSIAAGQRLAILGRNGAGKSTLLATLAGLREPATGRIELGGSPYAALTPRAFVFSPACN
jgi:iron complex transport system ATP-binding protein